MGEPIMSEQVAAYLSGFSGEMGERLQQVRGLVHAEAPEAVESLSYGLLAYKLNRKPLIYFGGFARHLGMYATPVGHEAFVTEFAPYKQGKGSVQLPLRDPLPTELIAKVIAYRVQQVRANTSA